MLFLNPFPTRPLSSTLNPEPKLITAENETMPGWQEIPFIVVTGGPCGGKSTLLARMHELLLDYGIHVIVLSETATELITAGLSPSVIGVELFQQQLLAYSMDREEQYRKMARMLSLRDERKVVVLCDQGALDCAAYITADQFRKLLDSMRLTRSDLMHRYDLVIHMVTAADGAEEHYTLANNTARSETAAEARILDARTQRAWIDHSHFFVIDNSTSFDEKVRRALKTFARKLHMPEPTEIEKRYLVLNFTHESMPADAVPSDIVQTYLTLIPDCDQRRVRLRIAQDGGASFFYTEKKATGRSGEALERERLITPGEYEELLRETDHTRAPLFKTRYCFIYEGQRFELDLFTGRHRGRVKLEIELSDIDAPFTLPPWWNYQEITDDPKNRDSEIVRLDWTQS